MPLPSDCSQHFTTMNLASLLEAHTIDSIDRKEKIAIININPELADYLLSINFEDNRTLSVPHVKRMAADMKSGLWILSNDAVCIDVSNRLINANHRMNAVKLSQTTQPFLVMWDVPEATAQQLDVGRKRTMHERITISGTRMTVKECAIIRHTMNEYSKAALGTIEYSFARHDRVVEKYYSLHCDFMKAMNAKQMTGSAFIKAAALKIYVEMTHYSFKHVFSHDMSAFDRSMLFIDLVENGYSNHGFTVGETEISSIKLRNMKAKKKADARGNYWSDKDAFQYTMSIAFKFMTGEIIENVSKYKKDPFTNFLSAPTTNTQGFENV